MVDATVGGRPGGGALELSATQRWMQAAITDGARGRPVEAVVAGTSALPAEQRLELYRRGYRARLLGCLRETHPALRHALGDEVFEAFALDYLDAHPPRGYTLTRLSSRWPEHLQATRPDRDAPRRELWPDFLVDLARLERAFQEVYDGPGEEGRAPARTTNPRRASGASTTATAEPVACLRLLRSRYPIARYLRAVRAGEEPELPSPEDAFVAVNRRAWVVTLTELDASAYALLDALAGGDELGAAASAAAVSIDEAWRLVRAWIAGGLLRAIIAGREREPVLPSTSEVVR